MSFDDSLSLIVAEATAGLPDNFSVLSRKPEDWRRLQRAWKRENMVAVIEVTNKMCKDLQQLFIELARKFSSVPFLRVDIDLGTYAKLRDDLGGVQYIPTIIVVLFHDDKPKIAKIEGVSAISGAIRSGKEEALIVAYMDEGVRLRKADSHPEQMALKLASAAGGSAMAAKSRREELTKETQQQRGSLTRDDDDKDDKTRVETP